jgi:hypothetical protein
MAHEQPTVDEEPVASPWPWQRRLPWMALFIALVLSLVGFASHRPVNGTFWGIASLWDAWTIVRWRRVDRKGSRPPSPYAFFIVWAAGLLAVAIWAATQARIWPAVWAGMAGVASALLALVTWRASER